MNMKTDMIKQLSNFDKNDILEALGLETRKSSTDMVLPVLGIFTAGLIAGLGAGLMLAPKSGQELRDDAMDAAGQAQDKVKGTMDKAKGQARDAANKVSEHVAD